MEYTVFRPKIDWWIYLVLIVMVCGSLFGMMYEGNQIGGVIIGACMLALWVFAVSGVKYAISGREIGIRNFYRWTWIPIDKINTVEKQHGMCVLGFASATLSLDRVRITLSDRGVLRSSMPIDISPKDRDGFIACLKSINPEITIV